MQISLPVHTVNHYLVSCIHKYNCISINKIKQFLLITEIEIKNQIMKNMAKITNWIVTDRHTIFIKISML